MSNSRNFPVQYSPDFAPHPLEIPWEVAEQAFEVYAKIYGNHQSLKRIAERGGFGVFEMDLFLPEWREFSRRLRGESDA